MRSMEPTSFITAEKYENDKARRIKETAKLREQDLYTVMLRLGSNAYQAVRKSARLIEARRESGLLAVRLEFVNDDLETEKFGETTISDGYLSGFSDTVILAPPQHNGLRDNLPIVEGYIKDYFDDFCEALDEFVDSVLCY